MEKVELTVEEAFNALKDIAKTYTTPYTDMMAMLLSVAEATVHLSEEEGCKLNSMCEKDPDTSRFITVVESGYNV